MKTKPKALSNFPSPLAALAGTWLVLLLRMVLMWGSPTAPGLASPDNRGQKHLYQLGGHPFSCWEAQQVLWG